MQSVTSCLNCESRVAICASLRSRYALAGAACLVLELIVPWSCAGAEWLALVGVSGLRGSSPVDAKKPLSSMEAVRASHRSKLGVAEVESIAGVGASRWRRCIEGSLSTIVELWDVEVEVVVLLGFRDGRKCMDFPLTIETTRCVLTPLHRA